MTAEAENNASEQSLLAMTASVVSAYLSHNALPAAQIPELIHTVFKSLTDTRGPAAALPREPQKPMVSVKRSVTPDYIICLEDGKKLKMLKRHLRTNYNMSPEEYRAKWGLQADYPMVAPNYAKQRSEFAKKIGLGRKRPAAGRRRRRAKA
ncbi:MAG TPA: MucR family transcriptional regulator [Alphaproteobacteria bacterium]